MLKLLLIILPLFTVGCLTRSHANNAINVGYDCDDNFIVADFCLGKGDLQKYVRALVGEPDYQTKSWNDLIVWRYSRYKKELVFDENQELLRVKDISLLP